MKHLASAFNTMKQFTTGTIHGVVKFPFNIDPKPTWRLYCRIPEFVFCEETNLYSLLRSSSSSMSKARVGVPGLTDVEENIDFESFNLAAFKIAHKRRTDLRVP